MDVLVDVDSVNVDNVDGAIMEVDENPSVGFYNWHIPNAILLRLYGDLLKDVGVFGEWVDIAAKLRGIGLGDNVILYDEIDNRHAALAFMILRAYGYEGVSLLNGGRLARQLLNRPRCVCGGHHVQRSIKQGTNLIGNRLRDYFVSFNDVWDVVKDGGVGKDIAIIDTRSLDEYVGVIGIWGHIPGAINIPWTSVIDQETGGFRDTSLIREVFRKMVYIPTTTSYFIAGLVPGLHWYGSH
ncbi:MAG: rhodanese-like domain-containing protein [Vulcanisaeta sp.]